jgi:polar amino acid transport system permease protein
MKLRKVKETYGCNVSANDGGAEEVVHLKYWGRWVGVGLLALFVAWLCYELLTNPGFQWPVVGQYLFASSILKGVLITIELTILCMLIGIVLGVVLAVMELSPNPVLSTAAHAYIWFFRGTPALVQLIFWYNLAVLFPTISLGIPFGGPRLFDVSSNVAISAFTAALLGLGLNEGAYMAEIVRGGIIAIDPGQREAAHSIGLTPFETMRHVIFPQAMRGIVPPTGNQVIGMLKFTSLASVIAVTELLQASELIYARTYQVIPLLITASIWYLFLTTLLTVGQIYIERHYAKGSTRVEAPRPFARIRGGFRNA